MTKICTKCKIEFSLDKFPRKNRNKSGLSPICFTCNRNNFKVWYANKENRNSHRISVRSANRRGYKRNRDFVNKHLLEHPCVDCGESDIRCLDFDHVRGEKKYCVSELMSRRASLGVIVVEIDKCEVRCANCHRRKTAKQLGYYSKMAPKIILTIADVDLIKLLYNKGLSMEKIAKKFLVSRKTVSKVLRDEYPINKDNNYDGR
jgi:AraC-like DNA-binding protein